MTPGVRWTWLKLTVLGALSGVIAAALVLVFHGGIELGQRLLLPPGRHGNYEALSPWLCLVLPVAGGLVLGLAFDRLAAAHRAVGITHVLRRLRAGPREPLPPANLGVQLLGGVAAIVSGQSVDREGPSVHLGAAGASLLGRLFPATGGIQRTLIACGAAAGIAAAFNTPLAAVAFVIEVLKIRYDVERFLPVIVAAVVGAVLGQAIYQLPAFEVPALAVLPQWELPSLLLLGVLTGGLATIFIGICGGVTRWARDWPCGLSFTVAGAVTGVLALGAPQIMGTSYDTLPGLLDGTIALPCVLLLLASKLLATGVAVGMRLPGGLIGPMLLIGGAAGSAYGQVLLQVQPLATASPGFYATIGMVAMMGASLRAPLAALTALLEMTGDIHVILAGMVAVAAAELTNRLILGKASVFEVLIDIQDERGGRS